jgi:hypothetical protein
MMTRTFVAKPFSGRPGAFDLAKQAWVDKMVMCDDRVHYINLNENKSHFHWVMKKHPDGPYVSVRQASQVEVYVAIARSEWLESSV